MTGLRKIVSAQRPHCPNCHHPLDLTEFANELFKQILDRLSAGEKVLIARFGTFAARYIQGHKINHFGEEKKVQGRNVIRFRAASGAKKLVNARFFEMETLSERRTRRARRTAAEARTGSEAVASTDAETNGGSDEAADAPTVISSARRRARACKRDHTPG